MKKTAITIQCSDQFGDITTRVVSGYSHKCMPGLTIHRADPDSSRIWTLSHNNSGLLVDSGFATRAAAVAFATRISAVVKFDSFTHHDEVSSEHIQAIRAIRAETSHKI